MAISIAPSPDGMKVGFAYILRSEEDANRKLTLAVLVSMPQNTEIPLSKGKPCLTMNPNSTKENTRRWVGICNPYPHHDLALHSASLTSSGSSRHRFRGLRRNIITSGGRTSLRGPAPLIGTQQDLRSMGSI